MADPKTDQQSEPQNTAPEAPPDNQSPEPNAQAPGQPQVAAAMQPPPPELNPTQADFYKLMAARMKMQLAANAFSELQRQAGVIRKEMDESREKLTAIENDLQAKLESPIPLRIYQLDEKNEKLFLDPQILGQMGAAVPGMQPGAPRPKPTPVPPAANEG